MSWTPGGNALGHLILWFNDDFSGEPKTGHPIGNTYTFNGITPGNYAVVVVAYDAAGAYVYELALVHLAGTTLSLADRIKALPWLADGVTEDENRAVRALQDILRESPAIVEALLGFPWLVDGVTEDESWGIHHFRGILQEDPAVAETLLGFPWFPDGVTEDERRVIYDLRQILRKEPAMAETLSASSWFSDGVTRTERQTLDGLRHLYDLDRSSLSTLTTKPWFKDGLSSEKFMSEEFRLVGDLGRIANQSETDFLAIVGMPFLETFELADAMAVRSLRRLTCCEEFRRVMTHPTISDGITDEEAKIVATLYNVRFFSTDIYDPLLDPDTVTLEERDRQPASLRGYSTDHHPDTPGGGTHHGLAGARRADR